MSVEIASHNADRPGAIAFELTWPIIGKSGYPSMTASDVQKEGLKLMNADER